MSTPQSFIVLKVEALSYAQTTTRMGVVLDGSAPFTIDAWINFNGLCSMAGILSQQNGFNFGIVGNALCLQIPGYPQILSDSSVQALDDIDWHYVAVTFDGTSVRFYINGQFNSLQSYFGTGTTSPNAFMIGSDLQATIQTVRVYNTVLSADTILGNMFNDPPTANITAYFDFTQSPPIDTGPNHFPIALLNGAAMVTDVPAVELSGTSYTVPLQNELVNPGGYQIDPYTVQAWIYVNSTVNPLQTVFINSDSESDTGMTLFLLWDSTVPGYRLVSQRGANLTANSLISTVTITMNAWVNVATTYDGTKLSLYINGTLDSSSPFGPITLIRNASDLVIGAGLSQGLAVISTAFQGYINRVDVWSIALSATQIALHMGAPPDIPTAGLEAVYDFTTNPCRNQVTQTPVGLNDGAVISAQEVMATSSLQVAAEKSPAPDSRLDLATIQRLRASVNLAGFVAEHRDSLLKAMESDVLTFADTAAKSKIRTAWMEQIRRMTDDPDSLRFWISSHRVGKDRVLLCHTGNESRVVYSSSSADVDDCTMWTVTLLFTVVAGILDAFFGLSASLTDRAISYIQQILRNPRVMAIMATGALMSSQTIFTLGSTLWNMGAFKQLLYMIVDLGFWAFLRVVAKLILKLVGVGAVDTIASLVATAATFIYVYTQKPSSCDPLPTLNLAAIKFNYDPTQASVDALSIRKNYTTKVDVPEWVSGRTNPADSPAAYSIAAVTGKSITIQVKFTASTNNSFSAQIQASGGGILGVVDPVTVNFLNGVSNPIFVTIPLNHHTLATGGVQVQNISWNWSYQLSGGSWTSMGSSYHRIYALLATPTMPWIQASTSSETQLPWTAILDYACVWAAGKTTETDIATAVTQEVNTNIGLSYDTNAGAPFFTDTTPGGDMRFMATKFVNYLSGVVLSSRANCTDCATMVATFSNILGCNLTESTMYDSVSGSGFSGFYCNKMIAIGGGAWAYPFPLQPFPNNVTFAYHEVAWMGSLGYNDNLYDACLQCDSGSNPWNWTDPSITHTPYLPVNMVFTNSPIPTTLPLATPFTSLYYRERLAQNSAQGITACVPHGPFPYYNTQNGRRQVY